MDTNSPDRALGLNGLSPRHSSFLYQQETESVHHSLSTQMIVAITSDIANNLNLLLDVRRARTLSQASIHNANFLPAYMRLRSVLGFTAAFPPLFTLSNGQSVSSFASVPPTSLSVISPKVFQTI